MNRFAFNELIRRTRMAPFMRADMAKGGWMHIDCGECLRIKILKNVVRATGAEEILTEVVLTHLDTQQDRVLEDDPSIETILDAAWILHEAAEAAKETTP